MNVHAEVSTSLPSLYIPSQMRRTLLSDLDTLLYGLVDDGVPLGESMYRMTHALEIACGPGTWTLETAQSYPHMHFHAIDPDASLIHFACSQTALRHLNNVRFEVADWHDLRSLPDKCVDLVQVRFVLSMLDPTRWQDALSEWLRVCRPGALLVWLESGAFTTTSAAWNEWASLIVHTLRQEQRLTKITHDIMRTLHKHSHQPVQHSTHLLDLSADTPNHEILQQQYDALVDAFHDLLLHSYMLDATCCWTLYQRMYEEMFEPSFRAQWQFVRLWVKL